MNETHTHPFSALLVKGMLGLNVRMLVAGAVMAVVAVLAHIVMTVRG